MASKYSKETNKKLTKIIILVLSERLVSADMTFQICEYYACFVKPFCVAIPRTYKKVHKEVSFLPQLDSRILCLQNAFLQPMIVMAVSLELTYTSFLWEFSKQPSYIFFIFFSICFSALHGLKPNLKKVQYNSCNSNIKSWVTWVYFHEKIS